MLARKYTLTGKKRFEKVLREGRFIQANAFGLALLKREDQDQTLFGFIVSAKVSKEAVQRNRVKRAMSEAVRFLTARAKNGYDIVFLAKQKSTQISTDEIMREVSEILIKTEIVK
jgi:ribonuclease P protein component